MTHRPSLLNLIYLTKQHCKRPLTAVDRTYFLGGQETATPLLSRKLSRVFYRVVSVVQGSFDPAHYRLRFSSKNQVIQCDKFVWRMLQSACLVRPLFPCRVENPDTT
ncbi:MAG: hypothetical protein ACJAZY_000926 [Spirosomataceae bacterium]|jgi:hypothetical protein